MNKEFIAKEFMHIQDEICLGLEQLDGNQTFQEDNWNRPGGGGGRTRVIQNGDLLEKGGVNFSSVEGEISKVMREQLQLDGSSFFATGVSIVLHPKNPMVPIIHMNIRYFELDNGTYWFGGGIDMSPHYVDPKMAGQFHRRLKTICDAFNPNAYQAYKKWADDYFYLPHRNETRGVGGIFFDHLKENEVNNKQQLFNFCCDLGRNFVSIYAEQASAFRSLPFDDSSIQWRNIRRGRYVEFNLVYDRGTTFGLKTGGRTESILMSLPETAQWFYDYQANEKEQETLKWLKKDIDWVSQY